jgi:Tol biopolymer transport system component
MHQGTLYAAAFNPDLLKLLDPPVRVLETVAGGFGRGHFDVARDGTLIYVKGSLTDEEQRQPAELEWVDREGNRESLMPEDAYGYIFRLSPEPEGRFLVYALHDGEQADIWTYDIERGAATKLSFDLADEFNPVWSPSGKTVVFSSYRDGVPHLYWKRIDDSGHAQRLTDSLNYQTPWSWHGRQLAIFDASSEGAADLRIVNLQGDEQSGWTAGETTDFMATPFFEMDVSFSPDGQWLAYISDESGRMQVYVCSFPDGGAKKRISIEGFASRVPLWSQTSQELIFATREKSDSKEWQIFSAKYRVENRTFIPERPVRWEGGTTDGSGYPSYDLHPDGKRLLVSKHLENESQEAEQTFDHVVLFDNFFDYLRDRVPTGEQ